MTTDVARQMAEIIAGPGVNLDDITSITAALLSARYTSEEICPNVDRAIALARQIRNRPMPGEFQSIGTAAGDVVSGLARKLTRAAE